MPTNRTPGDASILKDRAHASGNESKPRKAMARGLLSSRKILDVAASLFLSKGLEATTVDEIVAAAGIAKGTFYHHFTSKTALVDAIRLTVISDFEEHLESRLAQCPPGDISLKLDTWVRAVCEGYILMIPRHQLAFSDKEYHWTVSDARFSQCLVSILKQGNKEGRWVVKNPSIAATFIVRGLLGVIDDQLLAGKSLRTVHRHIGDLVRATVSPL